MYTNTIKTVSNALIILFLAFMGLEIYLNWLVSGYTEDATLFGVWMSMNVIFFLLNFYCLVPYFLKSGFGLKQFLLLAGVYFALKICGDICFKYYIHFYHLKDNKFYFDFESSLRIYQNAIYFFLFSTCSKVIYMLRNNQLEIDTLDIETHELNLKKIQSSIQPKIISNYISYLQIKNNTQDISDEIVELAEFMRYCTYDSIDSKTSFLKEYEQLNRYCAVLGKSSDIDVKLTQNITKNPSINTFGLLLPLKEFFTNLPKITTLEVSYTLENDLIYAYFKADNINFSNYKSQFNLVPITLSSFKIQCPTK